MNDPHWGWCEAIVLGRFVNRPYGDWGCLFIRSREDSAGRTFSGAHSDAPTMLGAVDSSHTVREGSYNLMCSHINGALPLLRRSINYDIMYLPDPPLSAGTYYTEDI